MNPRDDNATTFAACRLVNGNAIFARLGHPDTFCGTGRRSSRPRPRRLDLNQHNPPYEEIDTLLGSARRAAVGPHQKSVVRRSGNVVFLR